MAAELEHRNGAANMFFSKAGGTPWHREGTPISGEEQHDFDGLMERHFNYPLEKRPYFVPTDPTATEDQMVYVKGEGAHYVWRPDTMKCLGSVGSAYEIVSNREAFEVLKPLIDQRVAAVETGGVLRDGADAWLLVRWDTDKFGPDVKDVFTRDGGILPFSTVLANHSGRRGVMLGNTAIRIVCANTLGAAESEAEGYRASRWRTVSHKHGAKVRLVEAAQELFSGVVRNFEVIARQYRALMRCRLEDAAFSSLVLDVVAPDPRKDPKFNPEAKLAGTVLDRALAKRSKVRELWTGGRGHTGEKNGWYAYQAAVEALDHDRNLWPTRAGSWRTASLIDGELARMKNAVLDGLVNVAAMAA